MMKKNRVKLICLMFFLAAAVFLLTGNTTITRVQAFSTGPPAGHAGAPGESSCIECHAGGLNAGGGQFTINGLPARYEPGTTYEVTVRHSTTNNSRRRWGFQLTVLTANNIKAGELANNSGITSIINEERQYIEHNIGGTFTGQTGSAQWTFNWTAPATNVGPVTFYAAGNQANSDGTTGGDQIYTTNVTVNPPAASSGPPRITEVRINKKQLIIMGENFDFGAVLLMDGVRVKKTFNDEIAPTTILVARKAGKQIAVGQEVMLQVRNLDDTLSEVFPFKRLE